MVPYFPQKISSTGIALYIASLAVVSIAFINYALGFVWIALGLLGVIGFFVLSANLTHTWQRSTPKDYTMKVFSVALFLRIVWVVFSYYFYQSQTGQPFEWGAADSLGYHSAAEWLEGEPWSVAWNYLFVNRRVVSDSGFVLWLTVLYKFFGVNLFVPRLLNTIFGAFTCVLLYKLASRSINEQVGRMVGIFSVFMPNFIIYCGLHLKEVLMLFIIVAFLERADYVLRASKVKFWNVVLPLALAGSLFLFRTVLGVVAFFSFITAILFSPTRVVKRGRKVIVVFWAVLAVIVLAGGVIMNEVESLWNERFSNQENKRTEQTMRGNQWAKYATGTVMAPMVFVLPFSTMVDTDQQNQALIHGGNYIRNFMGAFAIIALINALFIKKNWRDFALIGSFVIGYLGVVSLSGFANSERFLLPGLPCLIIIWAYGISVLNAKSYKFVRVWYVVVPVMEIAWAYFKIGSRGWL